ncbi:Glutathione S-transferase A (GST-A) (GST class-theta), partial [Durusdinium trenchii]
MGDRPGQLLQEQQAPQPRDGAEEEAAEAEEEASESESSEDEIDLSGAATDDASCARTLYWGSGSPPAWRARLCLETKQIPYRSVMLSFEKKQHKTPQILSLNPRGMVPIFVDSDTVLYESLGIIQYIEMEIESEVSLLPKNKRLRARALVRMNEANNVSAVVGEVVYYLRRTPQVQINEDYLRVKREALYKEIALWESYLDAGDYLAGDSISLADISFFPTIAYTVRLGFDLSSFPRLKSYYNRMLQTRGVQHSWPPHWKKTEGA